ncbi:hypothetical protein BB934_45165 (plasmid) [Microvirga ossetica]|uniref:Uncharacterized protein n=1 Tax=Microvirga ossetica TaxID=1882682 RepID=A0A1B2EZQ4_9HYPH|nr:hypothetical protein [Microvirga ossetica]ANY85412.1 hypothetical protein BB934_45165 [Microvirga ossetica]
MIEFGAKNNLMVLESMDREIEEVEGYLADLKAIRQGEVPESAADASLLDEWCMSEMGVQCLVGKVIKHPEMPKKKRTRTIQIADLHLISYELGLARTLSQWFRLGRENPEGDEISGAELYRQLMRHVELPDNPDKGDDDPWGKPD